MKILQAYPELNGFFSDLASSEFSLIRRIVNLAWHILKTSFAFLTHHLFGRKVEQLEPATSCFQFCGRLSTPEKTRQPKNPEIALLASKFNDAWPELKTALKKGVWKANAEACLRLTYELCILALNECESVEELTALDTHYYRWFFSFPSLYHLVRTGSKKLGNCQTTAVLDPRPFYTPGTQQNEWRELYNSYCRHLRNRIPINDLKAKSYRHFEWTRPDLEPHSYERPLSIV